MVIVSLAPDARAQASGFAVGRFEPADPGSDWYVVDSLDLRGHLRPSAGIVLDWAYKPLAQFAPNLEGPPVANLITDQIVAHASSSLILLERLRVSASVPVTLYQHGDDGAPRFAATRPPREVPSVGDVSMAVDLAVWNQYGSRVRAALGVRAFAPTGSRSRYTSDGTFRATPRFMLAGDLGFFSYGGHIGLAIRPFEGSFEGRRLGHEATFAVAAGVKVNDRFVFGPELHGSTVITHGQAFRTRSTPLEVLIGMHVHVTDDIQVGTAIGPGLTRGDGAPSMRVLASIEVIPDLCVDKDGDGICKTRDACPEEAGPRSTDRRTNGCPVDPSVDKPLVVPPLPPAPPGTPEGLPESEPTPRAPPDQPEPDAR